MESFQILVPPLVSQWSASNQRHQGLVVAVNYTVVHPVGGGDAVSASSVDLRPSRSSNIVATDHLELSRKGVVYLVLAETGKTRPNASVVA